MKLIIWDFDGTLADTRPLIEAGMDYTLEHLGLDPSLKAEWLKYVGLPLDMGMRNTFGPLGLDLERVLPVYRGFGHTEHEYMIKPFEGMDELLDRLSGTGIPMAIATSKRGVPVRRQIAHLGWTDHFRTIVTPDEVQAGKPDPESLRLILAIHGLEPVEAVMVGDTPFDLDMARAAGVPSLAVGHGFYGQADLMPCGPRGYASDTAALGELLFAWREA
jgi:HAD superfamily hydrolase (TIGR01509 family)